MDLPECIKKVIYEFLNHKDKVTICRLFNLEVPPISTFLEPDLYFATRNTTGLSLPRVYCLLKLIRREELAWGFNNHDYDEETLVDHRYHNKLGDVMKDTFLYRREKDRSIYFKGVPEQTLQILFRLYPCDRDIEYWLECIWCRKYKLIELTQSGEIKHTLYRNGSDICKALCPCYVHKYQLIENQENLIL